MGKNTIKPASIQEKSYFDNFEINNYIEGLVNKLNEAINKINQNASTISALEKRIEALEQIKTNLN